MGAALIYAYWEPLQGFFKALWQGIQTVFSKAWEGLRAALAFHPVGLLAANWRPVLAFFGRIWQGVSAWLGGLSLFEAGRAILATLGEGIRAAGGLVGDAVRAVFAKVRDLLPFSDARAGPLSTLTASGGQLVTTLGAGIRRAGSAPLRQPLARTLGAATAGLALTLPAAPDLAPRPPAAFGSALAAPPTLRVPPRAGSAAPREPAARPAAPVVHHHYRIELRQAPGEDPQALAERLLRELERLQRRQARGALHDAL